MRTCQKCSQPVPDDRKICRNCGAILEGVPDTTVPTEDASWASVFQPGIPPVAEPPEAELDDDNERPIDARFVESEEPASPDTKTSAWKCPQCGEWVPGTFDVCWQCLTTTDGEHVQQDQPTFFPEIPAADQPDEEFEPAGRDAEPWEPDETEPETRSPATCARCGSTRMMHGVTIRDQGESSDGQLQVVICGDPTALIFKDRLYGNVTADICGDCGHAELRVGNSRALYWHYLKARGL